MDRRTGPNQFAPSSQRIEIKKKKNIFFFGGVVGRVVGRGGWMVRRAGPNQFASSTFSKLVA